jgi:hypothetical protein
MKFAEKLKLGWLNNLTNADEAVSVSHIFNSTFANRLTVPLFIDLSGL